ncbi:unnamed protein product [Auanema sp. JU1783]|nr:unnamed protein product [Auanema sp. JU1783]
MTEGTTAPAHDEQTLEKIRSVELQIKRYCNFIPISNWGFDEDTLDFMRERKHKIVDEKLSEQEKLHLSNFKKQKVARAMGTVCSTVSEVFDFLGNEGRSNTLPKKVILKKPEKKDKSGPRKYGKAPEQSEATAETKESAHDSEEEEEEEEEELPTDKKKTKSSNTSEKKNGKSTNDEIKKASKPVAAVKPTPRKESSQEQDASMEEESGTSPALAPEKSFDADSDSTDDETEIDVKSGGKKRKLPVKTDINVKKSKIDKELEKFENVDISTLDPIESRKVAMLKLQKKLELMKVSRTTTKTHVKADALKRVEERKMKRRMNKLKGKQKRAQEKGSTSEKADVKPKVVARKDEELPRTEEGNIVYSKFDFIVKDDERKKRSTNAEKRDKFTGKDYKSLLNKVEKRDEKLANLHKNEPEKAKEMEESIKWNRVLKKAEGVKVKDNAELLKKGLKRKEKLKQKKLDKWDSRVEKVKTDKSAKQDKRTTNLQKRVDDKKKKKLQKMRKKGRIL